MSVCAIEPCNAQVCERECVCVQSFNVCLLMSCVCAAANVCVSECGKLMKNKGGKNRSKYYKYHQVILLYHTCAAQYGGAFSCTYV